MFQRVRYIPLVLLALCFTFAGCVTVNYTALVSDVFVPGDKDPDVLFTAPNVPFVIIGLLQADGPVGTTHPQLIEFMKTKAKEKGAHAIYILSLQERLTPQGIMYNPWLGGYQTIGGYNVPRAYSLALRYKEGDIAETKKIVGHWIGHGISTVVGKFTLAVTINEIKGGISGVVTASSGLSGTITGYIENKSVELIVLPSNPKEDCILKFVGSYDGIDLIKGQYTSIFCSVSEGGIIEMSRSKIPEIPDRDEKIKTQDKIGL